MALNFPSTPTHGQVYDSGTDDYTYDSDGTTWVKSHGAFTLADNIIGAFGDGEDLQIKHDGSNSIINDNGTGNLYIQGGGTNLMRTGTSKMVFLAGVNEANYSLTGTVLDATNGTIQYKTLASNTTFTESMENGDSILLMIDDGTAYTITWPTITWVTDEGVAPTLETTGYTFISIWQANGVLYGAKVNA